MKMFLANLILALIWGAMIGEMTFSNFVMGFIVGYIILLLTQRLAAVESRYFGKVWYALRFFVFFVKEMIVASFRVAHSVIAPRDYSRPGIIAYPVDGMRPIEITLLAKVISLTPGTLSMDVSADQKWLFIHAMFIDDADALKRGIKATLEKPLLEVLR